MDKKKKKNSTLRDCSFLLWHFFLPPFNEVQFFSSFFPGRPSLLLHPRCHLGADGIDSMLSLLWPSSHSSYTSTSFVSLDRSQKCHDGSN